VVKLPVKRVTKILVAKYTCQQCAQEFISYRKTPKFCSKACKDKNQAADIDVEKAIALYQSGMTQKDVAVEMGTTQKVVFNLLKREGVKSRKAAKRNQEGESNDNWKGGTTIHNGYITGTLW
jgi:hypothetical protein